MAMGCFGGVYDSEFSRPMVSERDESRLSVLAAGQGQWLWKRLDW